MRERGFRTRLKRKSHPYIFADILGEYDSFGVNLPKLHFSQYFHKNFASALHICENCLRYAVKIWRKSQHLLIVATVCAKNFAKMFVRDFVRAKKKTSVGLSVFNSSMLHIFQQILFRILCLKLTHPCARNYRHSFRENKPKTLVFYDWIRAFWARFHENAGL